MSTQLTADDAVHVYAEEHGAQTKIMDVYVFDAAAAGVELAYDDLLTWVSDRIERCAPIFRQRLVRVPGDLDYPYWSLDATFDLRNHVTLTASAGPGWDSLMHQIGGIVDGPVDLTRPPWELHVITDVSGIADLPADAAVAVLKFHHCVGDATETVRLGRQLFASESEPATADVGTERDRSRLSMLGVAVRRAPRSVARLVSGLARLRKDGRGAAAEIPAAARQWPQTRFNRPLTSTLRFGRVVFDLPAVMAVRSQCLGATVNDVVLSVIADAMSAYLAEVGEWPDGSLGARMPYSTRAFKESTAGNRFDVLSVNLHTDVADPLERLRAIRDSAQEAKDGLTKRLGAPNAHTLDEIPAPYMRMALKADARARRAGQPVLGGNTLISNVGRGIADLQLLGSPVVDSFGILPITDGAGLSHFVASLADRLTITFTADAVMMPELERYARLLRAGFTELAALSELEASQADTSA
ncbi:wax ester/triacylglycerol synthase family O-acyltransferase [Rhodococcus spelaei]|uniref:wax ester/triacylglycerol synthase family O-acyltransferase n=1 Tax=Rhodococcus spelaei TaxID=2546320 RepID=UPI0015EF9F1F|nr:wax ester/triacylglycerol synthase family O-acyltransferase [Rhodococcus spelaei]